MTPTLRYLPLLLAPLLALVLGLPGPAETVPVVPVYEVKKSTERAYGREREVNGRRLYYYRVPFLIRRNGVTVADVPPAEIVVREEGERIEDVEIIPPQLVPPTTVLALDISGSMDRPSSSGKSKMQEAQAAARQFLDRLDARADAGLVLFDHQVRMTIEPVKDRAKVRSHRQHLQRMIAEARPQGGTAYLDATLTSLAMLEKVEGPRAVILMTDGVDLNSKTRVDLVVGQAKKANVPVYTVGVGQAVTKVPVTTALVLDRSGSMAGPAGPGDKTSKMRALHDAACHFVDLMRSNSAVGMVPFSTAVDVPTTLLGLRTGLTDQDKGLLKAEIRRLTPFGGTCLYDATTEGIETVAAADRPGKRVVVVLTDGVDEAPGSRQRVENVIERARETKVQLYTLGFGQEGEVDKAVLERMAKETGGKFYMATNRQELYDLFEKLYVDVYDEGIDEDALIKLAERTGGKYYPAPDAAKLDVTYAQVADDLKLTYYAVFPSRRQVADGTLPNVDIQVEQGGVAVSAPTTFKIARRGLVVVPEVNHWVYALCLAGLLAALGAPALLRRQSSTPAEP